MLMWRGKKPTAQPSDAQPDYSIDKKKKKKKIID